MNRKLPITSVLIALIIAAPCHAASIASDQINLTYGGGLTATGSISFAAEHFQNGILFYPSPNLSVTLDGTPLGPWIFPLTGHGNPTGLPLYFATPQGFPVSLTWPVEHIPTDASEFLLNGFAPISGTVTCTGECTGYTPPPEPPSVSATPIPATLPLFGSAIAGFALIARRKTRA